MGTVQRNVIRLDECTSELAGRVGGKAVGLGHLLRQSLEVPAGLVDTADASFAGQQDTYLWVSGASSLLAHVVRCWGSLFTPQAISYRRRLGIPPEEVAMAVVVQRMVAAEAAGVMMTIDPVSGDRSQ